MTVPFKTDARLLPNYRIARQNWLAMMPEQAAIVALAPRYWRYPGEPELPYDRMVLGDLYVDVTVKSLGMIAFEIADERKEMVAEDILA